MRSVAVGDVVAVIGSDRHRRNVSARPVGRYTSPRRQCSADRTVARSLCWLDGRHGEGSLPSAGLRSGCDEFCIPQDAKYVPCREQVEIVVRPPSKARAVALAP